MEAKKSICGQLGQFSLKFQTYIQGVRLIRKLLITESAEESSESREMKLATISEHKMSEVVQPEVAFAVGTQRGQDPKAITQKSRYLSFDLGPSVYGII